MFYIGTYSYHCVSAVAKGVSVDTHLFNHIIKRKVQSQKNSKQKQKERYTYKGIDID